MEKKQKKDAFITISKNCVNVFVGFKYTLKYDPFETQTEIKGNVLYMYIIDACNDVYDACYGRGICYYTFNFVFEYREEIDQRYKILVIDPRIENPIIVSEGIISFSTLP